MVDVEADTSVVSRRKTGGCGAARAGATSTQAQETSAERSRRRMLVVVDGEESRGGRGVVIYPPGAVVGRARGVPTKQMWRRRWGCKILHADVAAACVRPLQCAAPLASPRRADKMRGAGALPPRQGGLRQVGVAIRGGCCGGHAAASSSLHARAHLRCISCACRVQQRAWRCVCFECVLLQRTPVGQATHCTGSHKQQGVRSRHCMALGLKHAPHVWLGGWVATGGTGLSGSRCYQGHGTSCQGDVVRGTWSGGPRRARLFYRGMWLWLALARERAATTA